MVAPLAQLQESQKLTADALVDLFEITLVGTPVTTYLTDGPTCTWQGHTYAGEACKLSSVALSIQGGLPRPTLIVLNPLNVLSQYAFAGYFERATVVRRKVLRQHLVANVNLSDNQYWYISRVKDLLGNQTISFELRMLSDGPNQQVPARMYCPPQFPWVSLG